MMKIFVVGANGVWGRRVVPLLMTDGHRVTAIGRTPEKRATLERCGPYPIGVDVFDPRAVQRATVGHDVVMNLATCIPSPVKAAPKKDWTANDRLANDRLRTEASRNLADAVLANACGRFVQESARFPTAITATAGSPRLRRWKPRHSTRASRRRGIRSARRGRLGAIGVVLRFANFYSTDSEQTALTVRLARRRINVLPGVGYWPMIHADHAAAAVVASIRAPSGVWNVVDDEQLTKGERAQALAAAVGRVRVRSVPLAVYRLAGSNGAMLLRSQRVGNAAFKAATAWSPVHPSFRTGIVIVAEENA